MAEAPIIDGSGAVTLDDAAFGAAFHESLVHESVRAELAARRQGTHSTRTRGLVSGGGAKPWRQKGTGRARAGTTRAPQFTGGGVAFPPGARSFAVKMNRKAHRSALRGTLSSHASAGTLAVVDASAFAEPSTKKAAELVSAWGKELPLVVVATEDETSLIRSFRNLRRVLVTVPSAVDVATLAWARSLLVSAAALEQVQRRAA